MSPKPAAPALLPLAPAELYGREPVSNAGGSPAADLAFAEVLLRKSWGNVENVLRRYVRGDSTRQLELAVARGHLEELVRFAKAVIERGA